MVNDRDVASVDDDRDYLSLGKYISEATSNGRASNFDMTNDVLDDANNIKSYNMKFKQGIRNCQDAHEKIHDETTKRNYVKRLVRVEQELNTIHRSDDIIGKAQSLWDKMDSIAKDWADDFNLDKTFRGTNGIHFNNKEYSVDPQRIHFILMELGKRNTNATVRFPNTSNIKSLKRVERDTQLSIDGKPTKGYIESDEAEDNIPDDQDYKIDIRDVNRKVKAREFMQSLGEYTENEPKFCRNFNDTPELRPELWRDVFTPPGEKYENRLPAPREYRTSVDDLLNGMNKSDLLSSNRVTLFGNISSDVVYYETEMGEEFAKEIEEISRYVMRAYNSAGEIAE